MAENEQKELTKSEKLAESIKDLDVMDLMAKKMTLVKDLDKNIKQVSTVDLTKAIDLMKELDKMIKQLSTINVTKASERAKIDKHLEKMGQLIASMSLIDQVLSEKNKLLKSMEKVSEISEAIPVVEKTIKQKDF